MLQKFIMPLTWASASILELRLVLGRGGEKRAWLASCARWLAVQEVMCARPFSLLLSCGEMFFGYLGKQSLLSLDSLLCSPSLAPLVVPSSRQCVHLSVSPVGASLPCPLLVGSNHFSGVVALPSWRVGHFTVSCFFMSTPGPLSFCHCSC